MALNRDLTVDEWSKLFTYMGEIEIMVGDDKSEEEIFEIILGQNFELTSIYEKNEYYDHFVKK
jgi:hypothetical protein